MNYQAEKELALKIVTEAAKLCQRVQQTDGEKRLKRPIPVPLLWQISGRKPFYVKG
ncbi:hypothetical protein CWATWH0402_2451 [Crocosphaera watsonii WH 0402]|uniref:Uncharacterized protein n=1 Tax=Crocosphaera watsonii WH 0402 TaxID=1284629 RepID=T2JLH1_CROWT|nr:hypothetical protein CWATWH0402_2451 [Crocosphaera watsonii WH 0402]